MFTLRAVGNLKGRSSRDGSLIQSYRIPRSAIQVSSVDPCPGINDLTKCHHLQQLCECWSWWSFFPSCFHCKVASKTRDVDMLHVFPVWDVFYVQSVGLRICLNSRMTWDMLKPLARWDRIFHSFVSRLPPSWLEAPYCPVWKNMHWYCTVIFCSAYCTSCVYVYAFMPTAGVYDACRKHISSWTLSDRDFGPLPLCTAMLERYRQILLAVWAFGSFQSWSRLP